MMEKLAPYRVFTSSSLKLIAVITMFIDHFGATVMGQAVLRLPAVKADAGLYQNMLLLYRLIRYIGRIAFPIYCFLLVGFSAYPQQNEISAAAWDFCTDFRDSF